MWFSKKYLNPTAEFWDEAEREIHTIKSGPENLQEWHDAIISAWTRMSKECIKHLVKSMPQIKKVAFRAKDAVLVCIVMLRCA